MISLFSLLPIIFVSDHKSSISVNWYKRQFSHFQNKNLEFFICLSFVSLRYSHILTAHDLEPALMRNSLQEKNIYIPGIQCDYSWFLVYLMRKQSLWISDCFGRKEQLIILWLYSDISIILSLSCFKYIFFIMAINSQNSWRWSQIA